MSESTTESTTEAPPESIVLDLDAEQKPTQEIKPEFAVLINDRRIVMEDPSNLDWRDLLVLESPVELFRLCLTPEDRKFLFEQALPGWKLNRLMQAFTEHFDLDEKMRQARRQQQLSGL